MFERGRGETQRDLVGMPVEVRFADGNTTRGKLVVPAGKGMAEVLNGEGAFLEFEPYGGERSFVAKTQFASIRLLGVPKVPDLNTRMRDLDGFDPFTVLGLSAGASRDEIRQAYIGLAKCYHPDRYASADLPTEVIEYLFAMARRINAAHDALNVEQRKQAARAEPVFVSPGR